MVYYSIQGVQPYENSERDMSEIQAIQNTIGERDRV